jgi:rubrerythrin
MQQLEKEAGGTNIWICPKCNKQNSSIFHIACPSCGYNSTREEREKIL